MPENTLFNNTMRNKILLLIILLLDLIGFSLIFPIIPNLLEFYLHQVKPGHIDYWLIQFRDSLAIFLPDNRVNNHDDIVLMGGLIASVYSFLQFIFTPLWGKLSDYYGRRKILLITSMGLAVSYLFWMVSSTFTMFLISRILGGIMAGNLGVASAAMADMTDEKNRTRAMGMLGAAMGVGFMVGPAVGGLSSRLDLTQLFPGISFLHPYSVCAVISFSLSLFSALLNLSYFHETVQFKPDRTPTFHTNPLTAIRSELNIPGFQLLLLVNFLFLFLFSGLEFSLGFLLKQDYHLEPIGIGLFFLYTGVIIVIGQGFLVRKLAPLLQEKRLTLLGILLMPLPTILIAKFKGDMYQALFYMIPISLGVSFVQPALTGLASLITPRDRQGMALGAFRSAGSLARASGPIAGAYLYWIYGVDVAYLFIGGSIFLLFFLGLSLRTRPQAHQNES